MPNGSYPREFELPTWNSSHRFEAPAHVPVQCPQGRNLKKRRPADDGTSCLPADNRPARLLSQDAKVAGQHDMIAAAGHSRACVHEEYAISPWLLACHYVGEYPAAPFRANSGTWHLSSREQSRVRDDGRPASLVHPVCHERMLTGPMATSRGGPAPPGSSGWTRLLSAPIR
ncbi:hypothetical protein BV20DRAFT_545957 [Pilatotrama ljubarskyi]|nr:hypothetical protein BV20DRAFT_545957 [Pilatotrama ljubarskyi]